MVRSYKKSIIICLQYGSEWDIKDQKEISKHYENIRQD